MMSPTNERRRWRGGYQKKQIIHQVSQNFKDASSITIFYYYCVSTMNYSYILNVFLLLFSPATVASKTMTSSSTTIASCLAEYNYGQSDCDCQYYQKSQCKPNFYNNDEGASYRPKDQGWNDTCATCCCLCKFLLQA
jgi:hypothetical protein